MSFSFGTCVVDAQVARILLLGISIWACLVQVVLAITLAGTHSLKLADLTHFERSFPGPFRTEKLCTVLARQSFAARWQRIKHTKKPRARSNDYLNNTLARRPNTTFGKALSSPNSPETERLSIGMDFPPEPQPHIGLTWSVAMFNGWHRTCPPSVQEDPA